MDFIPGLFLISLHMPHIKATLESESGLFLTLENGTSGARNKNVRPLFSINIQGVFLTVLPKFQC